MKKLLLLLACIPMLTGCKSTYYSKIKEIYSSDQFLLVEIKDTKFSNQFIIITYYKYGNGFIKRESTIIFTDDGNYIITGEN